MQRALILATILTMSGGVASAGTYLGFGVGPAAAVSDDSNQLEPSGRTWHALVGYRFGRLSIEGGLSEYSLVDGMFGKAINADLDTNQLSVSAKYSIPLSAGFEAFGRGGIQRTGISNNSGTFDRSGTGLLLGAGIEYRLNFVLADASIFLEYTYSHATLGDDAPRDNDGYSTRIWTLGLTIGI